MKNVERKVSLQNMLDICSSHSFNLKHSWHRSSKPDTIIVFVTIYTLSTPNTDRYYKISDLVAVEKLQCGYINGSINNLILKMPYQIQGDKKKDGHAHQVIKFYISELV